MSTQLVTTFMATLAGLGVLGVAASLLSEPVRAMLRESGLSLAAAVAVLATLSSLYLSEIADYTPCQYCWWQRVFMYPLAVVLPIAAIRRDHDIRRYALPLAAIGGMISLRHIWLQTFPSADGTCGIAAPCTAKLVEAYGFVTIPAMTAICFGLVLTLLIRSTPTAHETTPLT